MLLSQSETLAYRALIQNPELTTSPKLLTKLNKLRAANPEIDREYRWDRENDRGPAIRGVR